MSERSKGDVSPRVNNNANRIVKNSLLSASVTGLSFDDFPNKPLLLPAAPPVVHAPPPQPTNALIAGILNREPKTLVTVGQSSSIDDSETLDEINLNASSSDDSAAAAANASINPYLNVGDGNANPLLEPPTNTDSLLSQAASSFGALPSVASNVFSTFSKRIYAGSREADEQQPQPQLQLQPQLEIQPTYIQQVGQVPPAVAPFYAAPPAAVGEAAPEPPKFYAPTELPNLGAGPSLPPTSAGQNTYRITARKKLYAPIPGLSEQQQQQQQHQQQQVQSAGAPFQTPPYPAPAAFEPPVPAPPVPEERKSGGGLFSLTNLVPTGVLQNISGLVQSATGRTTTSEPPSASAPVSYNAPNPGYFDITTASGAASQPTSNYFTPTAITAPVGAAPAATNYFVPTAAPPTVGGFFNPLAVGSAPGAVPPPAVGSFYNPLAVASPAPPGGIFNPLAVTSTSEVVHPPTVGGFFTPAAVAPPSTAAPSSAFAQPPPVAAPLTLGQPPAATAAPVVAQSLPVVPTTVAAPPQPLAAPPAIAPPPAFTQPSTLVESTSAFAPPPVAVASVVPPPAAGLTSYRLQKGTRLYKSPLTAQETAPPTATFGQQAGFTATPFAPTSSTPAAIFNPFGGVSGTAPFAALAPTISPAANAASSQEAELVPTATSLFTPQTNTAVVPSINTSLFAPIQAQEVLLFPSSTAESTQGLSLYPPAVPQSVSEPAATKVESAQEVQLFAVPPTSASFQGVPLFASPTAESSQPPKTEAAQEVQLFAAPPTSASFQSAPLYPSPSAESSQPPKAAPVQEVPPFAAPPTNASFQASSLFGSSTAEATQGLPLYPPVTPQATIEPQLPQTEQSVQEVPLFAAPPASDTAASSVQTVDLFASSSTPSSLFKPEEAEQKVPTAPQSESKEVTTSALQEAAAYEDQTSQGQTLCPSADSKQNSTLFVPVPTAEIGQAIALYPPEATVAAPAEFSQGIPLFAPGESTDSAATSTTQSTTVYSTEAPPTLNANSLFAPTATTESQEAAVSVANVTQSQIATTSVALTTQTTTTFFNPFAQTVTTPLPQDLLPPPIGFVAPDTKQLFEAQTIEPVLSEAEKVETLAATAAAPPPPPPTAAAAVKQSDATSQANPFRKSNETVSHPSAAPSPLQSFFTPAGNSSDFNFFAAPPKEEPPQQAVGQFPELPPQLNVAPPPLAQEQAATVDSIGQSSHALGFEQLISDSQQATQQIQNSNEKVYQNSSVNSFSGYFGGPVEVAPPPIVQAQPPPQSTGNFFDHFAGSAQGQEDQRIQNFFNNPPQNDQPSAPGELKYDIVHSGLPTKHFEERSQTSVSNQVEPPSSACSDFSTATKGAVAQQPQQELQPERQVEDLQQLYQGELPDEILQQLRMASEKGQAIAPPADAVAYTPALLHWFFKRSIDGKFVWTPFSHYDSALLETSLTSDESDSSCIVPVEGGRYDVNIKERTKTPVFWDGKAIEVRRCSWFYKAVDSKYVPYAEETAAALEVEYKRATETGEWLKKIPLPNGEQVTMHGPNVIVHFMPPSHADTWGGPVQSSSRPLVVKRDLIDFKIQQGESQRVDHLLFMVHGIGSVCDLKMRNVEEVVDDFRIIAQQLVQSHYKNSTDMGLVGRVEVLPIEWHGHLHSEELGIDEKLKSITLESIPRLRNFTNDTLLDVLFYTSPKYCQKIMNTVADALNEVYLKYRMRHPEFNGGVSLAGHSLGSLILFDLLCHQEPLKECEEENKENPDHLPQKHSQNMEPKQVQLPNNDQMLPKQVSYAMGLGPAGTGQPVINYTQLIFHPKKFFALGSPIGMFVTIRGIDKLGLDFRLPTCPGFYNIFHPFDPVAYRIEALVNADMKGIRPVLIPHHKGRKRMHLELKETMTRVGADIKQRFMDTFKTTLDSVHFLATVTKVKREAEESLEKANSSQVFERNTEDQDESSVATTSTYARNRTDSESTTNSDPEFIELDFPLGKLNDSKRVDYVLQEAPLEFINEYLFALSSHVCYWASEDTILFVMKEIYAGLGISTDSQVPQQSMTIERPSSRTNSVSQSLLPIKIIQRIFNLCNSNLVNGLIKLRSLTLSEINPQRITV